ncbi:adenylylsulfate kinase [Vibrio cholerae]|nr:adenylylsulfate kinase [Vibrio metoecus]EII7298332.1 adenylylsulfate kinase [Vibrio cholerae]EJL6895995.1 adenylylsulfate kinase [Vibrio cholerae]EKF6143375.1 adenylylsulfate kinase [Vibrio cholerae]EKF9618147.1 adenylylsulfate kinase [Vibrio cholerae]ELE0369253.1 adenylylsulfate kinase [Vibrio cholerae]
MASALPAKLGLSTVIAAHAAVYLLLPLLTSVGSVCVSLRRGEN